MTRETEEFKVGDKVRRISGEHCGMKIGDTSTVLSIYPSEDGVVLNGFGDGIHDIMNLELVEEFKAGDLVRIKGYCSGCEEGEVYIIHNGDRYGYYKEKLYAWRETMTNGGCSCQMNWEKVKVDKPSSVSKEARLSPDRMAQFYKEYNSYYYGSTTQDPATSLRHIPMPQGFYSNLSDPFTEDLKREKNIRNNFIQPKQTFMQKLSSTLKRILNPQMQSMYKAGFLGEDLTLTESGKRALQTVLVEKHETELAKLAEEQLKDDPECK